MTKTKQGLAWIAKGSLRKDMEAELGLTREECRQLIQHLRRSGYIEQAYTLTEKGQQRMEFVPKSDPKALARWRDHYRRTKPETAEKMVARVERSPLNSVFALGAQA